MSRGRPGEVQNIRYRYIKDSGCGTNRMMVSVSKRLFKRAVKRNLLKRRIRESYRTLKHNLPEGGGTDILFVYNTREILTYSEIRDTIEKIINRISGKNG